MKLQTENHEYEVSFTHEHPMHVERPFHYVGGHESESGIIIVGITTCIMDRVGSQMLGGQGVAFCSSHDNFDRKIGRKVAFADAIKNLDKSERTQLWEAYKKKMRYK